MGVTDATFRIRWRQYIPGTRKDGLEYVEQLSDATGTTYFTRSEAFDLCDRLNRAWVNQLEHWPVSYSVSPEGNLSKEAREYREYMGFPMRRKPRRESPRTAPLSTTEARNGG